MESFTLVAPLAAGRSADPEKAAAVKAALMHSWEGYKKFAWGFDELMPKVLACTHARCACMQSCQRLLAYNHFSCMCVYNTYIYIYISPNQTVTTSIYIW